MGVRVLDVLWMALEIVGLLMLLVIGCGLFYLVARAVWLGILWTTAHWF